MDPSLLVNFGGPRTLEEIPLFLTELLCDREVIRTPLPSFLHNPLFRWIAQKRSRKIRVDYELIGGKSPIYFDTEAIAKSLAQKLSHPVLTFHRYLPSTHEESLAQIESSPADILRVLPLFPQFTYATTGSIARFFSKHLSSKALQKLQWIRSYPTAPPFISALQKNISDFLRQQRLSPVDTILLFSAHGLPKKFIEQGDSYQSECEQSFSEVMKAFPGTLARLSFQSKFGPGEWIRPYTIDVCSDILSWNQGKKHLVFIPLSFTSDHIETLFEIEHQYLPIIEEKRVRAYRCPALNLEPYWIDSLATLLLESPTSANQDLIRCS